MQIAYHASHEQFTPSHLLRLVEQAEKSGFTAITASDHFHPWTPAQGESGFVWSWLGAAMRNSQLPFSIVNCPYQRYHPAIIAQAAATLDEMYPKRFHFAAGDGEALNECITGEKWPIKDERRLRLLEAVDIIRKLWVGKTVTHHGLLHVENATLYTRPTDMLPIFGAALTAKTAAWLGSWADGMITVLQPMEQLKEVVKSFRSTAGIDKPMHLKVQISYAKDMNEAAETALEQWGSCIYASDIATKLSTPEQFAAVGQFIKKEDLTDFILMSNDVKQFRDWLQQYIEMGFSTITLHNVNKMQEDFIQVFGEEVIPALNTLP